jgi:hypothetical protein
MPVKYHAFDQNVEYAPAPPNVKVKTILKCKHCQAERETEISVPHGTVVESVITRYSCADCFGRLSAVGARPGNLKHRAPALDEHRAALRAAEAARPLVDTQEPELLDEEIVAGD